MDIVYPCKIDTTNDTEELRYSLRSLENIPHTNVFIVGEKPAWVKNVIHIPIDQSLTKSENVARNIRAAVHCESLSDEFILMNDDMFIMKKINQLPVRHLGFMDAVIRQYEERYPESSQYITKMKKLYALLLSLGYARPLSYEAHIPMAFNKRDTARIMEEGNGPIYQLRTYYGNTHHLGGEKMDDVKIFLEAAHNPPAYNNSADAYLCDQTMLSATGGSFKRGAVGAYVRKQLSRKSHYEI